MPKPKGSAITTQEMEDRLNKFIEDHFSKSEITSLLVPHEADKIIFQSAAEKLYEALEKHKSELVDLLDRFTPHTSCQFSLLRDVFVCRYHAMLETVPA